MKNYFKPNTKKAIKLAIFVKSVTASLATMAFFNDKPNVLFIVMVTGAVCNELINFLSDGTDKNTH